MGEYRWKLEKKKYDPNQPRIPAGQSGGGRWTSGGGGGESFANMAVAGNVQKDKGLGGGVTESRLLSFGGGQDGVWKKDEPVNRADAEVAVDRLDNLLGMEVVPETVFLEREGKMGSCQRFVGDATTAAWILDNDGEARYNELLQSNRERVEAMIFLDWMSGNRDRHFGNVIFDKEGKLWAIDNGQAQDWDARRGAGKAWAGDLDPSVRQTGRYALTSPRLKESIGNIDSFGLLKVVKGTRYERQFEAALRKLRHVQNTGELIW